MAQIALTLPLGKGGLALRNQGWARCILDVWEYCSQLYIYSRDKGYSELQDFLFRRAAEYLWHAYYCAEPRNADVWLRFEAEQDLRSLWSDCIGMVRWGYEIPKDLLIGNRELYNVVFRAIQQRAEQYVSVAERHGGPDPTNRAIDAMQEELQQGRGEPCWGLVDYETGALFPIEGTSKAIEWTAEVDGKSLAIDEYSFGYNPEPRHVDVTFTGEDALKLLQETIREVEGQGTLMARWIIRRAFEEESARIGPDKVKLNVANEVIDAARAVIEEIQELLVTYSAKHRQMERLPKKRLIYDVLKFIVDEINQQAQEYGAKKKPLKDSTMYDYVDENSNYSVSPLKQHDDSMAWKACIYAIFPQIWEIEG